MAKDAEQPIQVQSLTLATEVNGGLARTRIELTFHNPNARRLEGELQFPLQPGQQVSGFALDIDGHMRAAVPVEKAKGQEVFEAVERRGVDPGLLEQTAGNQFRLRVYPIPANGERHVRIDIDQSLQREGEGWRLQLPLSFARGAGGFVLHVIARGQARAPRVVGGFGDVVFARERGEEGYMARIGDDSTVLRNGLTLDFEAARQAQAFVQEVDGQRYFHAEVPLAGASAQRAMPRTIGLLWDSSASARKRDIDAELAVLDRYFAAVGNGEVRLTRLRDVAEPTRVFTIRGGDWSALRKELRTTVYDGASALADWKPQADVQEYLLVSDGFSNYGLAHEMPQLASHQRMYTLDSAGADSDAARLTSWADARGGRLVSLQGSAGVADASRQLLQEGPHLISIEGLGADGLVAASRFPQSGYLRVAGRLNEQMATITLRVSEQGGERLITVPVVSNAPTSSQVAALWAGYTIGELSAEPELHRAQIHRLGSEFGLVSAETSLIVLENLNDYVRYDIAAPAEFRDEVARLAATRDAERVSARKAQIEKIADQFAEKIAWWEKSWPKNSAPVEAAKKAGAPPGGSGMTDNLASVVVTGSRVRRVDTETASPVSVQDQRSITAAEPPVVADAAMAPSPPPPAPAMLQARSVNRPQTIGAVAGSPMMAFSAAAADGREEADKTTGTTTNANIGIAMQSWKPDSPFARRLREARADQVYAIYLDERADHADSSAFYLDVADILFERGQRNLALRVLSNLAEMNLENRQLLRALGYRLMQAHATAQAVVVFEHVSRLADDEPQSWRDLGLADAAMGREQDAIDNLYKVVTGTWDSRFPSIELISLGELDAIVARAHKPLDTHAIDPRLLRNLPLDLRVVLSWDSDNTDIDLWVTDPNGEKTYYASPHSYQGGWLSHDCTQGYGPEEFILRNAKPGKYKVEANFFGDHEQLITGPTTLQLHLFTGFGTSRQKDQAVTMRLKDAKETVLVGEFEVK
ncbi:MAG TPA: VIT domain-containing protein [Xanthomonadaceae bacterium]|nr:VIT domain-containing protein [Xanthomonadaceae bacterium]